MRSAWLAARGSTSSRPKYFATGLPDTSLIPGPHRDSYDRCFRIAGGRIATAGTPERCTPNTCYSTR